jgi:protein-disulfide isomerase
MENNNMHDPWVDRSLAALDPPDTWHPDTARGWTRFRQRQKVHQVRRTRWTWAAVAASVTGIGLLLLTPAPCSGAGCIKTGSAAPPSAVALGPVAAIPPAAPVTVAQAVKPAPQAVKPAVPPVKMPAARNFKESGSVLAPITCELFTDYQCPHCATVFIQVIPGFIRNYVSTGKVKLIHRDFPLPMHAHARIAARYANAAGALGYYDIVVNQIFRTQAVWAESGDVGAQVAEVLAADVMNKVRNLVQNDAHLDDTVATDMAAGQHAGLTQTPSMLVVYKGKSQMLAPIPPRELLKSYFDELLTR